MTIKKILSTAKVNDIVIIQGWVRTVRGQQDLAFVNVSDGTCLNPIQIVVNKDIKNYDEICDLTTGCSVEIKGKLIESPAKGQKYEVLAENIRVLGLVEDPKTYPMPMKRLTPEHLRENAHLRARSNIFSAVSRIRQTAKKAIDDFFEQEDFVWVSTPILTSSDCEGAGEMFQVSTLDLENVPKNEDGTVDYSQDFFKKQVNLTVSGQLNAETLACALTKVYTFGPTFRAENSNTSRHLAEFWMVEPEVAFYDMNDAIALSERMLKYVIAQVLEKRSDDMEFFNKFVEKGCIDKLNDFVSKDFKVCDYSDAIEILKSCNKKFENKVEWGIDLASEHERYLAEEHFECPVAVTNYPKAIKSFYMRDNDDGKTVAAFDVLAPKIGEIIGGSQREERLEQLLTKMQEKGLNPKEYQWYVDTRRYGTVPHAGFGLGFERLISYITGVKNVRDTIAFPRTTGSIKY